jgi:quaternary ammonium compound-resistance protein SugE
MNMDFTDRPHVAWAIIVLGGIFQIGWSIGLDYTDGMTNLVWDVIVVAFLILSMLCLSIPMKSGIPMGTAYAVWIGIGVLLTIIISGLLGLETINIGMVAFMLVSITGVVGLKIVSDNNKN